MKAHEVIIYSKENCPYCVKAKRFFDEKNIKYIEHFLTSSLEMDQLKKRTGHLTFPQIFIDGKFIGGYTDLIEANLDFK